MTGRYDAVVVGSGPNGLGAAICLARAGFRVRVLEAASTLGGGARSAALTLPGFVHDVCSAIHPLALTSPFLRSLHLETRGIEWRHPSAPIGHPLDDGGALVERSIDDTAAALGADGDAWSRTMRPFADVWDALSPMLLAPITTPPSSPALMMRFGLAAMRSAAGFARSRFRTERARGLFMGIAAHAFSDLERPFTNAFGLVLGASAHAVGWPAPKGGSQRLVDALAAIAREHGCELTCDTRVRSMADVPDCDAVLFDTSARSLARIVGDALPATFRERLSRMRPGPGVFKIDYALDGPMPWKHGAMLRAGTVHLGGTLEEVVQSERDCVQGRVPARPFCLVAQQSLFDSTRAPAGKHTLWVYAHVPHGCREDMTPRIEAQLERFAPGFRGRVLQRATRDPEAIAAYNENYEGGDISAGSVQGAQLFFRPRATLRPYATPNPKIWLCSASTPPGPGVHAMCGYFAARAVAKRLSRRLR